MSNPATLLADLLAKWQVPANQRSEDVRGMTEVAELEFWQGQGRAAGLMLDIERALAGLEAAGHDVQAYWDATPQWYRAVFSYVVPWQSNGNAHRDVISVPYLSLLKGLGTLLEFADSSPVLLPAAIEQIVAALAEAEDLIKITLQLDEPSRRYMLSLVWEAKRCLAEIDTFGTAHVRTTVFALSGAMQSYAADLYETNPEAAKTWFQKARNVVAKLFMTSATKATEIGVTDVVQKMLE